MLKIPTQKDLEQPMEYFYINTLVDEHHTMATLQDKLLSLAVGDVDTTMEATQRKHSNIAIEIRISYQIGRSDMTWIHI